ncbi:FAD-dependent pyridine nucleotide-disulfide oxidoreductase [Dehalogenimonas lykanthroporepellens BL-DC-9]|nr:FAD-dependent pyridine nucleotide-disulfide oxidoreductase [Dehalogenimonas lykanthroporepellens BL-DC-9]
MNNNEACYDIIIIGGGIAGLASASFANGLGKKVLLVEKERIGGSCTLKTCMPTKSLIRSSVLANSLKRAKDYGLVYELSGYSGDQVFPYIRNVIEEVNKIDSPESFNSIGIDTILGPAEFLNQRQIKVGDRIYTSKKFIIATGSKQAKINITGAEHSNVLSIDGLFKLSKLPASMIVIGGGPAGVELGLALRLLGLEVTILEASKDILNREDQEIVVKFQEYVTRLGMEVVTGCKISHIECADNQVKVIAVDQTDKATHTYIAEKALITIGRTPDIESLNLENAGVKYSVRGITVNPSLRTSRRNIFAAGDVTGMTFNASMVERQALIAAGNALVPVINPERKLGEVVSVIYTEPPMARFGMTEKEAENRYGKNKITVYRYDYSRLRRAKMERQAFGLAKIICRNNGKIIGAHLWGERSEELIHELFLLSVTGKPLKYLHGISHAYPTYGEGVLKRLGDMAYVDYMAGNPFVRIGLKLLPGFENKLSLIKDKL